MTQIERETLEVDILFVGGGPSTLSAAIHLAQRCQKEGLELPNIAVIEKGAEIGAHQMSGAILNPSSLRELYPDFLGEGCPVESEVTSDGLFFLTKSSSTRFPILPPLFRNEGNYVISLSKFTRWLGEKAMELDINLFTGFTGTEILYEGDRVVGVVTGDKGINGKGEQKENFEPGVEIRAKCTIFGEGVRGFLTKSLIPKLGLGEGKSPAAFETGVKEVWECLPGRTTPGFVAHTMGHPLTRDTVGGGFLYGMKENLLSIGLVVSLDYADPFIEPYLELQKLKQHPWVSRIIEGGKQISYGAKAIAAGGYYAMPRLYFDGGMIVGESGQLLDISRIKGIHVGMKSGILAAETIFSVLKSNGSFSSDELKPYSDALLESQEGKDLYRARNFHQALSKGMPASFLHLGVQQITRGRGLVDPMPSHLDREQYKTVAQKHGNEQAAIPKHENRKHFVDKLTSVYNSGTLHEEDQPAHLKIGDFSICYDECVTAYRYPCTRFCPASVYEMSEEEGKHKLALNFTNCVHCQTCDIKCPKDNITWTPPEAEGGPRYSNQ